MAGGKRRCGTCTTVSMPSLPRLLHGQRYCQRDGCVLESNVRHRVEQRALSLRTRSSGAGARIEYLQRLAMNRGWAGAERSLWSVQMLAGRPIDSPIGLTIYRHVEASSSTAKGPRSGKQASGTLGWGILGKKPGDRLTPKS